MNYIVSVLLIVVLFFIGKKEFKQSRPHPSESISGIETTEKVNQSQGNTPDYATVFPDNKVLRFEIKILPSDWQTMQENLSQLTSSSGRGMRGGMPGGGGRGGFGGGQGGTMFPDENPVTVPCTVTFEGEKWGNAGIRYKGNSSLYNHSGDKYSFKIDFNEFMDSIPATVGQTFFGFDQLNLKSNFRDGSNMREKITADVFRSFGIASAHAAFCEVYLDNGSGLEYLGVYTLVEEVDDTVIKNQFSGNGTGNLYKPEGNGATFAQGSYNESNFYLKNNKDSADYSDVKALYNCINDPLRATDPEKWETELNSIFDVDIFLKWLAANTVMQNWDSYGRMSHNYYLYNNPATSKLTWIPWDFNESLQSQSSSRGGDGGGMQGGNRGGFGGARGGFGGGGRGALSLSLSETGSNWPLISNILGISEYREKYNSYIREFSEKIFEPSKMKATISGYYKLLKPYADKENANNSGNDNNSFYNDAEALKSFVESRNDEVETYLINK